MTELDEVCRALLRNGLIGIRTAASNGDVSWCKAEAEHLHNLPMLIGETDLTKHRCYVGIQRQGYIEWLRSTDRADVKEFVAVMYMPYWQALDRLLGLAGGAA